MEMKFRLLNYILGKNFRLSWETVERKIGVATRRDGGSGVSCSPRVAKILHFDVEDEVKSPIWSNEEEMKVVEKSNDFTAEKGYEITPLGKYKNIMMKWLYSLEENIKPRNIYTCLGSSHFLIINSFTDGKKLTLLTSIRYVSLLVWLSIKPEEKKKSGKLRTVVQNRPPIYGISATLPTICFGGFNNSHGHRFPVFLGKSLQFGQVLTIATTATPDNDPNYIQDPYLWRPITGVTHFSFTFVITSWYHSNFAFDS